MRPYVSVNELFCDARAQLKNYYTTFFGMSQATAAGTHAFHQLNPALVDAVYCYACRTFRGLSVCLSQATAAWMLYFVATDAYRSVAYISSDDERAAAIKHKLKRIPRDRCPPSRDQSRSFLGRTLCGAPAFAGWAVVYTIYNVQLWTPHVYWSRGLWSWTWPRPFANMVLLPPIRHCIRSRSSVTGGRHRNRIEYDA